MLHFLLLFKRVFCIYLHHNTYDARFIHIDLTSHFVPFWL